MNYTKIASLLEADGICIPEVFSASLDRYAALLREWNVTASLLSAGDIRDVETIHFPDACSLARLVGRLCEGGGLLFDIGSGGGLPAIPLKIALPHVPVLLVERSSRKVAFLRKAVAHLGLKDVRILHANFPEGLSEVAPQAIVARAVERPERLVPRILAFLPPGSHYLCQWAELPALPEGFHVERIEDAWTRAGLRRGELHVISRR